MTTEGTMETTMVHVESIEGDSGHVRVLHVGSATYQPLPRWAYELPVWYGAGGDDRARYRTPRRGEVLAIFRDGATPYVLARRHERGSERGA